MNRKILEKIIRDFAHLDSRIPEFIAETKNVDDLKELLKSFYCRNYLNEKALSFVENYHFPDSYTEISLDEDHRYLSLPPVFFFRNPLCYGKITDYENVLRFFAYNPNRFVHLFNLHRELFQFQPELPVDYRALMPARLENASPEVLQFYEEYVIKPGIKLMLEHWDGSSYFPSFITALSRNRIPHEIISKYVNDLIAIIERGTSTKTRLSDFVHTENVRLYLKFPELAIAVLRRVEKISPPTPDFFPELPEEVLDFLEKEYHLILKKITDTCLLGQILTNPSLSPEKHRKLYKEALKQFVKKDERVLKRLEKPVRVPENAVELFGFRDAFLIFRKAVYLYRTYLDFPWRSFQKRAFMFVIKNPSYMKEFQELVREYQELEKPVNSKIAKIMFYEFCLNRLRKYGETAPVLREIYRTFVHAGRELTVELMEKFLFTKSLYSGLREFEGFLYYTKTELPYSEVFEKHAETIVSCLQDKKEKEQ